MISQEITEHIPHLTEARETLRTWSELKIAADLRAKIMSGELEPGAKMPSTVELGQTYSAAPATAHNATKLLQPVEVSWS